jgi:hypothetical protein
MCGNATGNRSLPMFFRSVILCNLFVLICADADFITRTFTDFMKLGRIVPTLTDEVFNQLADKTTMGELARSIARAYLIDGTSQKETAKQFKRSQQYVSKIVNLIYQEYLKEVATAGVGVSELPAPLTVELEHFAEALRNYPDNAAAAVRVAVDGIKKATGKLTK